MKKILLHTLLPLFLLGAFYTAKAQLQISEPDKSPMDLIYYPHAYPVLKFQSKNPPARPTARVIYSRPQKKGRVIFGGDIVKYNEVWRLGANESTEIEFFTNASLGGKKIPKGRYSLFCIPQAGKWTIIINKDTDSWGAFSYKAANDLLRHDLPTKKMDESLEYFTMAFDTDGKLIIAWDDVRVNVPFVYTK